MKTRVKLLANAQQPVTIAKAIRNEHDREQAGLTPARERTEELVIAPYRENMAQTLKEQANFMRSVAGPKIANEPCAMHLAFRQPTDGVHHRQARSTENKPYNLPEKVCTHIARMNNQTAEWDKPLKDPPFRALRGVRK